MDEQKINAVTIPLEEYMDLIRKADFNQLLFEKITFWESQMRDYDRRIFELECRLPKPM